MSLFKGYFFDLDGTLIDTSACFEKILLDLNLITTPFDATAKFLCGVDSRALIDYLLGHEYGDINNLHAEFIDYYDSNLALYTFFYPGAQDLLISLKKNNLKTAIISNKDNVLCQKIAKIYDLHVDIVLGSGFLNHKKPHPAPLLYTMAKTRLSPKECCYIGDMPTDLRAARLALMPGYFARYGCYHYFDENFSYSREINSLSELEKMLVH